MTTSSPAGAGSAAQQRLVAVASGKGGVGKTWLATNLAQALAHEGRRVLLVDGDLGLANVDVQLGLTPNGDLAGVLHGRKTLAEAVTPVSGGADARGGFDVIAGRSGSATLSALSKPELQALAEGLVLIAAQYDRVVVDCGAGVDPAVMTFCDAAGTVLVVLTDEPTSLTDAYALAKLLAARGKGGALRVVVNNVADPAEGKRAYAALAKACRSFLGVEPPLIGLIRRDAKVRDAIRAQIAFLQRFPQAPAAHDVLSLARTLGADPASGRSAALTQALAARR